MGSLSAEKKGVHRAVLSQICCRFLLLFAQFLRYAGRSALPVYHGARDFCTTKWKDFSVPERGHPGACRTRLRFLRRAPPVQSLVRRIGRGGKKGKSRGKRCAAGAEKQKRPTTGERILLSWAACKDSIEERRPLVGRINDGGLHAFYACFSSKKCFFKMALAIKEPSKAAMATASKRTRHLQD